VHNCPGDVPKKNKGAGNSEPGEKIRTPDSHPKDFKAGGNRQDVNKRTGETWTRERVGRDHRGEKWDVTNRRGDRVGDVRADGSIARRTDR
jgi:filamentous hemagglutinin